MHTARLLTVSPSVHCAGGGGGWCLLPGDGGVCSWGGGVLGGRGGITADPPRTEFLTHATENITLPQTSFAAVIINHNSSKSAHKQTFMTEVNIIKNVSLTPVSLPVIPCSK